MDGWLILLIFLVIALIAWWTYSRWTVSREAFREAHPEALAVEEAVEFDDLTRIKGIGAKVQEVLNDAGIETFAQLAAKTPEDLDATLDPAGQIYATMDKTSWPEQAALAAEGKWEEPEVEEIVEPVEFDDLTRIKGVGPRVQELLNDAGIETFAQLAAKTPEDLDATLDPAGQIYATMDKTSWPEQAALAAEGKLEEPEVEEVAESVKFDDLTRIKGIGPKVQEVLNDAGIETFAQLAAKTPEELKAILNVFGRIYVAMDKTSWPRQAALAVEGKLEEPEVEEVVEPVEPDDLTRIKGIGPKVQEVLNDAGIETFAQLAAKTPEELKAILDVFGRIYVAMDKTSWPEQAALAAEGKWEEFATLQDELVSGR